MIFKLSRPRLNTEMYQSLEPSLHRCLQGLGCHPQHLIWNLAIGHAPRGFCGATGHLEDVQLMLVCAEPANPKPGESHSADGTVAGMVDSTYRFAWDALETPASPFHRNLRTILDLCWPGLSFEQQMRRTWLTESVLCSAPQPAAQVNRQVVTTCGERLLSAQLAALAKPGLVIGALGRKAQERLQWLGRNDFVPCFAAAPPGANRPEALDSWKRLAEQVHKAD